MIPKKIHYIWFGDKDFGPKEKYCVSGWQKMLPDYEIIRWDNSSLDEFDNAYFKEAIEAKRYAFASDYVRLKVLEEYGGIYLDTDEEILKSLDCFLDHDFFIGCQSCGSAKTINPALIGAIPHHPIIKDLLSIYDDMHYINADGSYNNVTNPNYVGKILTERYNLPTTYLKKGRIEFYKNSFLYDYFYFGKRNKYSYATHHYAGNWKPDWKIEDKWQFKYKDKVFVIRKYKRNREEAVFELDKNEKILAKIKTSKKSMYVLLKKAA